MRYHFILILIFLFLICGGCAKKDTEEQFPMLPKFEFTSTEGGTVNHEPFYNGVGVIAFVASWCGPCIREICELGELAANYENLKIVMLTYEQPDMMIKSADSMNIRLPIARADSAFFVTLQISTLPTRLLIDHGRIIFRVSGAPSTQDSQFLKTLEKAISGSSLSRNNSRKDFIK